MPTIDIILIVILILFTLSGLVSGFIRALGGLVGFIIGVLVSSWAVNTVLASVLTNRPILTIVAFVAIASIVSALLGWIVGLIDELRKLLTIIPFLGAANHALGGILGFVEGILVLAAIAYFSGAYLPQGTIADQFASSSILHLLSGLTNIIAFIFPSF